MNQSNRTIIYARCSTNKDQKPEVQLSELRNYCAARGWIIIEEIVDQGFSGGTKSRPGFKKLMTLVRERKVDIVVCTKLDRLFRSLQNLILTLQEFTELGVEFISVRDHVDMTTASGRLLLHLIAAFAEFELALATERTIAGVEYARSQGKRLGRPPIGNADKIFALRSQGLSYKKIASTLNCSVGVISRALALVSKSPQNAEKKSEVVTGVSSD